MSLYNVEELTEEAATKRLAEATQWASGGNPIALYSEGQSTLEFTEAIAAAVAAVATVPEDPDSAETRCKAVFVLARARDLQYAAMGRRRMFQLGVHNSFRELYETAKVAIDTQG